MKISRRTFIKTGMAGAAGLAVSGSLGFLYRDEIGVVQANEIVGFIRGNFEYLKLDVSDEDIEGFYKEYREWYKPVVRDHWQRVIKRRGPEVFVEDMDDVATVFLMSTDFFINGADEAKPVRYVRLYAPYKNSCWDPVGVMNVANSPAV